MCVHHSHDGAEGEVLAGLDEVLRRGEEGRHVVDVEHAHAHRRRRRQGAQLVTVRRPKYNVMYNEGDIGSLKVDVAKVDS